tara:strand:+ start:8033 stop:8599 length:567 start_codon:yes stop_codon:yes gene_type:complete
MFNFGKELRETEQFPVEIVENVKITKAFFVRGERFGEALDIIYQCEKEGTLFEHRQRIFAVDKDRVPTWSSYDKEINKLKQTLFHILSRFYTFEELKFEADSFESMSVKIIEFLEEGPIMNEDLFSLKFIFNRSFEYPEIPSNGRFMKTDKDLFTLGYTEWEKENRLLKDESEENNDSDNSNTSGYTL